MKKKLTIIALLFAVVFVVMIPLFFALPGKTKIWGEIQNFGHTILFGTLSILILFISSSLFAKTFKKRITHYLVAFGAAAFCGGLVEILQMFLPGDPDLGDFVRDILGAGAFLGFYLYFNGSLDQATPKFSVSKSKLPLIISSISLTISLIPGLLLAGAYIHRNMAFPLICGFDSMWEWKFIGTKNAVLGSAIPPAGWHKPPGDRVGQLELFPADSSGFYILEPGQDWSEFSSLSFEVYSELETPLELNVGIEDFFGKDLDEDRFNRTIIVNPALNKFNMPIEDIRNGPVFRKLNLSALCDLYFVAYNLKTNTKLYIDDLRLRP
jgi:hypothetical protein